MEQYNKINTDSVEIDFNVKLDLNDKDFDNKSKQYLVNLTHKLKIEHDKLKQEVLELSEIIENNKKNIDEKLDLLSNIENYYVDIIKKIT